MKSPVTRPVWAISLISTGVAACAAGIYLGETDDAPGAAIAGIVLMIGLVALGARQALRKK